MAPFLPLDLQYLIHVVIGTYVPVPDQPALIIPRLLCRPYPEFAYHFGDEASLLVPLALIPVDTSLPEARFFSGLAGGIPGAQQSMPDSIKMRHFAAKSAVREELDSNTREGLVLPRDQLVITQVETFEVNARHVCHGRILTPGGRIAAQFSQGGGTPVIFLEP
jgi:hypothetical protein